MFIAPPTPSQLGGQAHSPGPARETWRLSFSSGAAFSLCDAQALFSKPTSKNSLPLHEAYVLLWTPLLDLEDSPHLSDHPRPQILIKGISPQNEMQGWPRRAQAEQVPSVLPTNSPQGRVPPA